MLEILNSPVLLDQGDKNASRLLTNLARVCASTLSRLDYEEASVRAMGEMESKMSHFRSLAVERASSLEKGASRENEAKLLLDLMQSLSAAAPEEVLRLILRQARVVFDVEARDDMRLFLLGDGLSSSKGAALGIDLFECDDSMLLHEAQRMLTGIGKAINRVAQASWTLAFEELEASCSSVDISHLLARMQRTDSAGGGASDVGLPKPFVEVTPGGNTTWTVPLCMDIEDGTFSLAGHLGGSVGGQEDDTAPTTSLLGYLMIRKRKRSQDSGTAGAISVDLSPETPKDTYVHNGFIWARHASVMLYRSARALEGSIREKALSADLRRTTRGSRKACYRAILHILTARAVQAQARALNKWKRFTLTASMLTDSAKQTNSIEFTNLQLQLSRRHERASAEVLRKFAQSLCKVQLSDDVYAFVGTFVAQEYAQVFSSYEAALFVYDDATKVLTAQPSSLSQTIPLGRGITGATASMGGVHIVNEPKKDPRFVREIDQPAGALDTPAVMLNPMPMLCSALTSASGELLGVIRLTGKSKLYHSSHPQDKFSYEDKRLAESLSELAVSILGVCSAASERSTVFLQLREELEQGHERVGAASARLALANERYEASKLLQGVCDLNLFVRESSNLMKRLMRCDFCEVYVVGWECGDQKVVGVVGQLTRNTQQAVDQDEAVFWYNSNEDAVQARPRQASTMGTISNVLRSKAAGDGGNGVFIEDMAALKFEKDADISRLQSLKVAHAVVQQICVLRNGSRVPVGVICFGGIRGTRAFGEADVDRAKELAKGLAPCAWRVLEHNRLCKRFTASVNALRKLDARLRESQLKLATERQESAQMQKCISMCSGIAGAASFDAIEEIVFTELPPYINVKNVILHSAARSKESQVGTIKAAMEEGRSSTFKGKHSGIVMQAFRSSERVEGLVEGGVRIVCEPVLDSLARVVGVVEMEMIGRFEGDGDDPTPSTQLPSINEKLLSIAKGHISVALVEFAKREAAAKHDVRNKLIRQQGERLQGALLRMYRVSDFKGLVSYAAKAICVALRAAATKLYVVPSVEMREKVVGDGSGGGGGGGGGDGSGSGSGGSGTGMRKAVLWSLDDDNEDEQTFAVNVAGLLGQVYRSGKGAFVPRPESDGRYDSMVDIPFSVSDLGGPSKTGVVAAPIFASNGALCGILQAAIQRNDDDRLWKSTLSSIDVICESLGHAISSIDRSKELSCKAKVMAGAIATMRGQISEMNDVSAMRSRAAMRWVVGGAGGQRGRERG